MNGAGLASIIGSRGTSLAETRGMLGEYFDALKEQKDLLAQAGQVKFYTPEEVSQMGFSTETGEPFTLDTGWLLKVTPGANGAEPAVSFITPSDFLTDVETGQWEITQDQTFIAPSGKQYTSEELQAQLPEAEGVAISASGLAVDYSEEQLASIGLQTITPMAASYLVKLAGTDPQFFLKNVHEIGRTPDLEKILGLVGFTPEEINTVFNTRTLEDLIKSVFQLGYEGSIVPTTQAVMSLLENDPEAFIGEVTKRGWNFDTEYLLRSLYPEITEEDLEEIFGIFASEAEYRNLTLEQQLTKQRWEAVETPQWTKAITAGVGDVLSSGAGVFGWLGAEDLYEGYSQWGETLQAAAPPYELGDFNWGDLLHVELWTERLARALPFTLSLVPLMAGGWVAGSTIATAAGIGRIGTYLFASFGYGALSRAGESAMEAGGAYNDAITRGLSDEEASRQAREVFTKNMTLSGWDAMQIAIMLAPTPKFIPMRLVNSGLVRTARIGGKMIIVGLSEGGEEILQEIFQKQARGEEIHWDATLKEVFAIGSIFGIGMGLGGDVVSQVMNRTKENLSTEDRAREEEITEELKEQGISSEQAEAQALEQLTQESPDAQEQFIAATKAIKQERLDAKTFEEARIRAEEALKGAEEIPGVTGPSAVSEIQSWEKFRAEKQAELVNLTGEARTAAEEELRTIDVTLNSLRQRAAREKAIGETVPAQPAEEGVVPAPSEVSGIPEARQRIIPLPQEARLPEAPEPAPAPPGATGRVLESIQLNAPKKGFAEKIRQGVFQFQRHMIDDLYALKKFTEISTRGGVRLSIEENPYLLARLLRGIMGKANVFLEYGTMGKKYWRMEGTGQRARAVPNYTGESLQNILREVKNKNDWQDFTAYLVAKRSISLTARNIETGISDIDARATIAEQETKHNNFPELANRLYKYQDNLLGYANEMGLISADLLARLRQYGDYVPFYRVLNNLAQKGLMGKKMANIAQPIKRIKGSDLDIINPLESVVKNTYVLIDAAERNQVGIAMANLVDKNPELSDLFERVKTPITRVAQVSAKELGIEIEGLSDEESEAVVDVFRPSFFVKGDEVTVLIDGKRQYYRVDPDLRAALLSLNREDIGMIGKILSLPAKWLRAGATLNPDFMVRNPARDQLTAFIYSNYNFLPGIDFIRGLAELLGRGKDYQLFKSSGAERSMLVSLDRAYTNKTFMQVMKGKGFWNYVRHPLELLQIVSELGETATRLGEFKAGIRSGAIPPEAGYSAREVSLDFAKAGTTAYALNKLIAFFNANVRGWSKLISSFREHPVRTSVKTFLGITLPSILLYLANRDDDRWKEIPQWQKDLFWIIFTKDNIFRIPKPFEQGIIFGSIPERFLEYLDTKDPELFKDALLNLVEAGSPGFLPTAALPIIEWMTNYSFFRGYELVPDSRQDMPPELQYTDFSSETSKKIGELLNQSPAKIDNLINGWTGGLGRYAVNILDFILKKTGVSPDIAEPSPTLADMPVIKAFVVRNPYGSSGQTVENFYDLLEEYTEGEKYLKEMLNLGEEAKYEEYKASHPELLFFYDFENESGYSASARYLRQVAGILSELGKKQDEVYKSETMTPEEKRAAIDEIDMLKTETARQALNNFLGEVPDVLSARASDAENQLGIVLEDVPLLSQDKPDVYNMGDLSSDYADIFQGINWKDISSQPNMPITVQAWFDKEASEAESLIYPNVSIYQINADPTQGSTFEDYYRQWQERLGIADPTELARFDDLYPKAYLGNITKRQLELLREYNDLTPQEQADFLVEHPELKEDPREEWLKSHPEDNARLALWGQEKIYTLEAYNLVQKMITELDIPDGAIREFALPPKELVNDYFGYYDLVDKFSSNSAEAKLWKLEHPDFTNWAMENWGWEGTEDYKGIEYYQLEVKWDEQDTQYDGFGQRDSEFYIANEDAREKAREDFLANNPEYERSIYYRKAMDMEFPEDLIDTYADWYVNQPAKEDDPWYETHPNESFYGDDWFLLAHPEFYQAMINPTVMGENAWQPRDFSKVPTREVFGLYKQYLNLPAGQDRLDFRAKHPELDNWLVLTGKVAKLVGDRGDEEAETTPWEEQGNVEGFKGLFD